jgi:hypothetical protein
MEVLQGGLARMNKKGSTWRKMRPLTPQQMRRYAVKPIGIAEFDGRYACLEGRPESVNPHSPQSALWFAWRRGYVEMAGNMRFQKWQT